MLQIEKKKKKKKKRRGEVRRPNRNYRSYERLGLLKLWH